MSDANRMLDSAFESYNRGEFEQAEALVRDVLSVNPSEGDAIYLLGLIAYQAGAYEQAENLLYQAVRLYPDSMTYQLTLASILQKEGRLDEALKYYERFQDNPMGLAQTGFIYLKKNQDAFAESAFKKAISLYPNLAEAVLGLAQIEARQGLYEQALKSLSRYEPKSADIYAYLSYLYRKINRLEDALKSIIKAISIIDYADYELEKGIILEGLGRYEEAAEAYRKGIQLDAYRADIRANLGNVYRKLGDLRGAEDAYKRALQQDMNDVAAHHNLADLLQNEGRIPEALEHYRAILSIHPDYLPALYNLAILQEETGEEVEALGLYFNILAQKGNFPDLDWRIADTLSALAQKGKSEKKQALKFVEGWVRNFPENIVATHMLSALKGKRETQGKAAQYAKKLYDAFAPTYDARMNYLESTAVSELIRYLPKRCYEKVLDLGCGTGCFGRVFKSQNRKILGVDISQNMLKIAEETKGYEKLIAEEAITFLNTDKHKYDLIVAVELLGYIADILPLFSLIPTHLKKNGIFAFTIEIGGESSELGDTGRYLYAPTFIETNLAKSGLKIVEKQETNLRREGKGVAKGLLFYAQKIEQ